MGFLIKQAVSFVAEPILAAWQYYSSGVELDKPLATKMTKDTFKDDFNISGESRLPETVEQKIKNFIEDLGLSSDGIFFRQKNNDVSDAWMYGSLEKYGCAVLCITPEFAQRIEKQGINRKDGFKLIHELGHIILEHLGKDDDKREKKLSLLRLMSYGISFITFNCLFPMGTIGAHLSSCAIAKGVEFFSERKASINKEFEADHFAAKCSAELQQGGIESFLEEQEEHKKVREVALKILSENKTLSFSQRMMLHLMSTFITSDGNVLSDFSHPYFSKRSELLSSKGEGFRDLSCTSSQPLLF